MSHKSIKLFQDAYPNRRPSPAVEIRDTAAKLRAYAQSILARATELDETAARLEPSKVVWPTCDCGEPLTFDPANSNDERFCCWCPRCARIDGATFVYGYGRDKATALADWRARMDSF